MQKLRYKGFTGSFLIAAVVLCIFRVIHYCGEIHNGIQLNEAMNGIGGQYDYGTLVSYMEMMEAGSGADPIVMSAIMLAVMLCLGAAAVFVLLKGTEELKVPMVLCGVGIIATAALSCRAWFVFMVHINDMLCMAVMALVICALVMVVYYMRDMNREISKIVCLLIFVMAAVLFIDEGYDGLPDYASLDIFALALTVGGMMGAVRSDRGEPEENEEEESEDGEEEEVCEASEEINEEKI